MVVLVTLAGCSGLLVSEDATPTVSETATPTAVESQTTTPTATPSPTETPTPTETETPTPTPSPTETATQTPDDTLSSDNPWGQEIVPVRINDSADDGRNTTALTVRTIDYWNANIERYTDFEYRFVLAEGPDDARVEVQFRESVDRCDEQETNVAGCAAYLHEGTRARDLEVAAVESQGSNAGVLATTRHEFGHLVGLNHSDEPLDLMAQRYEGDIRDATDRPFPWYGDTLHVAVEPDTIDGDPAVVREQVRHAVEYYDAGADGTVPENVSVVVSDEPEFAEVVVTNDSERGCTVTDGSGALRSVRNLDTDERAELYTRMVVCIGPVGEDAVGWHTGYWLGSAFGLEDGERAAIFRTNDPREVRSDWWK
ncbi:Zn-dependent protease [Halomicrobium sp. LC1Hm]|nr:Zn-dependent protease [Halomicrobium sp. LC1Hm]